MFTSLLVLLGLLLAVAPAWAQPGPGLWGMPVDTVRGPFQLDGLDDIADVQMRGQRSAVFVLPGGGTLVGTLKPVICEQETCALADWQEDRAVFMRSNGQVLPSLTTANPNDPETLTIVTLLPARHVGVKVDLYTSGSAGNVFLIAMQQAPHQYALGVKAGQPAPVPIELVPGATVDSILVSTNHVWTTQGYNRRDCTQLLNELNDVAVINGAGAGQVSFYIPTGLTATVTFEARSGTNTYKPLDVFIRNLSTGVVERVQSKVLAGGEFRGFFIETGYTEYRLLVSAFTSGSATPCLEVSPGAGLVRAVRHPQGLEWWEGNEYTTQQTDATFKAAPGAGLAIYVTEVSITCNAAGTVHLRDGTSGDFIAKAYCDGQGAGIAMPFRTPRKLTANTALTVTTSGAFTATVSAGGFIAP